MTEVFDVPRTVLVANPLGLQAELLEEQPVTHTYWVWQYRVPFSREIKVTMADDPSHA